MRLFSKDQILRVLPPTSSLMEALSNAFVSYSKKNVVVANPSHLKFEDPPGDCCIKSGYVKGSEYFVVKIADGFYDNPKHGLQSSNGLMVVMNQKHGHLEAVLSDEGYLTDLRTALAAALAAKHLAPATPDAIGLIGTGVIGKLVLEQLLSVTSCRRVHAWVRSDESARHFTAHAKSLGYDCSCSKDADEVVRNSQLLVSATPSRTPLITKAAVQPGTCIIAMGADAEGKQELEVDLVASADLLVADSIEQCTSFGEFSHAHRAGRLGGVVELGQLIEDKSLHRAGSDDKRTIIVDSTGVAAQDVAIAEVVYASLRAA